MRKLTIALFATLFVVSMATVVLGQGFDGTLRGEVKDPNGLPIANAKVTVKNEATAETRVTSTSVVGTFNAPNLLIGIYTVTVEVEGFKKYVRKGVEVKQQQVTEVSISMEIGAVTTVVEVTASGELVQTTTSDLVNTWDNRAVNEIPLPSLAINPDPQNLVILLPGTNTQSGGVAGYGGSIGGNRPRDNNFVLDGVSNNDVGVTGPDQPVIPEAVGELTIITNQFSAEYGHSTAGQFIVNTKSGTNDVHGSGFWYSNNRAYNSVDNVTKSGILDGSLPGKPRFDLNRAGGTLGGPIVKDHWFIFGAYQYTTLGLAAIPSGTILIPTQAGLQTLQSLASTPATGVSATMVKILTDTGITAPTQSCTTGPTGNCPKVTNNSTGALVDIPVGGVAPSAPTFKAQHDFAISSDVQTGKHRFSARVLYDRQRQPDVATFPIPVFTGALGFDNRSVTFSDVYTITPHVVNEFRTGYRRTVGPNLIVPTLTPPGKLDVYPNFDFPSLGLTLGPDGCAPQSTTINTYQWTDNLSISKGAHTLKMGTTVIVWIPPVNFLPRARAEYRYASGSVSNGGTTTPVTWASELDNFAHDGIPNGLDLRGTGTGLFPWNQKAYYVFFQDDWKATSRLTLNLGIRYEYTTNPKTLEFQAQNSISDLPNPTNLGLPGVIPLFFSKLPATDTNNWGPRVGFAYDLFGNHKTAIRGGFAVAYDFLFNNFYSAGAVSPNLATEEDEFIACKLPTPPAYCVGGLPNPVGPFVANGGLPPAGITGALSQAAARNATGQIVLDQGTISPKVLTWSLGVQHEFGTNYAVEVRYVGTTGISLPVQIRLNAKPVPPDNSPLWLPTFVKASDVPATAPATPNLKGFLAFATNLGGKVYAVDGFNGNITSFLARGHSTYHGGSVDFTRRFTGLGRWSHGVFLKANYTYSKEIDNSTNEFFTSVVNPRRPQDFNNLSNERSRGAIDHTQKFALAAIYEVPWYHGSSSILRGVTNGWEISAAFVAETGQPVTIHNFLDVNNNGDSAGDRSVFNPNFTVANSTSDVSFVCRNGTTGATFIGTSVGSINSNGVASGCGVGQVVPLPNPDGSVVTTSASKFVVGYAANTPNAEFIVAQKGTKSNLGRNTASSAGINNWNLTFLKKTYITEQRYVEFRATLVNAFNHAQPILGGGTIDQTVTNARDIGNTLVIPTDPPNPLFLQPANNFSTGAGQAPFQRVITFGLRLVF
jgi:hypothetical protein